MPFIPTNSTLEEAIALTATGKFPYYHPCVKCGKACSMPTRPLWDKRVAKFGSIEAVYEQYICRNCSKKIKVEEPQEKEKQVVKVLPAVKEGNGDGEVVVIGTSPEDDGKGVAVELPEADASAASTATPPTRAFRREPRPGDVIGARPGYIGVTVWEEGIPINTTWTKIDSTAA